MNYLFSEFFKNRIKESYLELEGDDTVLWDLAVLIMKYRPMKEIFDYCLLQEPDCSSEFYRCCYLKNDYEMCALICKKQTESLSDKDYGRVIKIYPGDYFNLYSSYHGNRYTVEKSAKPIGYLGRILINEENWSNEFTRLAKILSKDENDRDAIEQLQKLENEKDARHQRERIVSVRDIINNFEFYNVSEELQMRAKVYDYSVEKFLDANNNLNFHIMVQKIPEKDVDGTLLSIENKVERQQVKSMVLMMKDPMFSPIFIDFARQYFIEHNFVQMLERDYIDLIFKFFKSMKNEINPAMTTFMGN